MKISELKRIARENDYELRKDKDYEGIILERRVDADGVISNVIMVSSKIKNQIFVKNEYCDDKDINMIKAAAAFAETPVGEREEEKKCIYEHKFIKSRNGNPVYFTIRQRPNISYPVLQGSSEDVFEYKVQFTDEEIKLVLQEYEIFLDAFERIEVEE